MQYKRPKLIQFSSLVKFLLNLLRHKYSRRLSELVSNAQMPFSCTLASHSVRCFILLMKWSTVHRASYRERKKERERVFGFIPLTMTQHRTVRHFNYRYTCILKIQCMLVARLSDEKLQNSIGCWL